MQEKYQKASKKSKTSSKKLKEMKKELAAKEVELLNSKSSSSAYVSLLSSLHFAP